MQSHPRRRDTGCAPKGEPKMRSYHFWTHDGYDGTGFDVSAETFEKAIEKAKRGSLETNWVSVTDGIETRYFNGCHA
jgi:hypothetical protein